MKENDFNSIAEIREVFPSADKVGKLTVFNVGGNKIRLIAAIHYNRKKTYIRAVSRAFRIGKFFANFPARSENRKLLDALNDAYANDMDEEEREFLRLAKIKQAQILDEWK